MLIRLRNDVLSVKVHVSVNLTGKPNTHGKIN